MGVVVIGGGGGAGGGGGPKLVATDDGKVMDGERVIAVFASHADAIGYAKLIGHDAKVIPFQTKYPGD